MEICFVRHGQTAFNAEGVWMGHTDPMLNSIGINQIANTSSLLCNYEKFDLIVSSPLMRAKASASIISGALDVNVDISDFLIERDMGLLSGKKKYFSLNANSYDLYKIEKDDQVYNRFLRFLEVYNSLNRIIIVSHSQFYKAVISLMPNSSLYKQSLDNGDFEFISI